jgi:phage tail tape-measure protein
MSESALERVFELAQRSASATKQDETALETFERLVAGLQTHVEQMPEHPEDRKLGPNESLDQAYREYDDKVNAELESLGQFVEQMLSVDLPEEDASETNGSHTAND